MGLNSLGLTHDFVAGRVKPGDFCIDATAGKGRDTVFLCGLVGPEGRVLALDIQEAAVKATEALVEEKGFKDRVRVVLDSHSHLERYAAPGTVDCIVFNFGWLPGEGHGVFTLPETSIPAIEQGLELLRPGGCMSLCIYAGGENGYRERDALLDYLEKVDDRRYTVLTVRFQNRRNDPPIPVLILKEQG